MSIEISYGELLDKISILRIKAARINDPGKSRHIAHELSLLESAWRATKLGEARIRSQYSELHSVNERLWDIEDQIRAKEAISEFDDDFVQLARSVYFTNDRRSALKRSINELLGSAIVEEKQYVDYSTK